MLASGDSRLVDVYALGGETGVILRDWSSIIPADKPPRIVFVVEALPKDSVRRYVETDDDVSVFYATVSEFAEDRGFQSHTGRHSSPSIFS